MNMNMNMNMNNGTDDYNDDNHMSMTFSNWKNYKLHLLFKGWNIENQTQYIFSWIGIVVFVIGIHYLKYGVKVIENKIKNCCEITPSYSLRFIHSFMYAIYHGMYLFTMLIAMTYNPGFFLAIIVGDFGGDYLFFCNTYAIDSFHH